mgnify:CR=1 FL=1
MAKRIPKALRKAIVRSLHTSDSAIPTEVISARVNDDPKTPPSMRTTPKQVAYMLNVMQRQTPDVIVEICKSLNGKSRHGNTRFRKQFTVNRYLSLAEAEDAVGNVMEKPKGETSILLSEAAMEYIVAKREQGVSAGQAVTNLVLADIEANGMPTKDANAEHLLNAAKHDLKSVTLHSLPYSVVSYLKTWRELHGISAGKVVEDLILIDLSLSD